MTNVSISSGIVPFGVCRGNLYFLLGREQAFANVGPMWCGLEGGSEVCETDVEHIAARECTEESMGCVFSQSSAELANSLLKGEFYTKSSCTIPQRNKNQERTCTLFAKFVEFDPYIEVRFKEIRRAVLIMRSEYKRLACLYPKVPIPARSAHQVAEELDASSGGGLMSRLNHDSTGLSRVWGVDEWCYPTPMGICIVRTATNARIYVDRSDMSPHDQSTIVSWLAEWLTFGEKVSAAVSACECGGAVKPIYSPEEGYLTRVEFREERLEKTSLVWWSRRHLEEAFRWRRTRQMFRPRFVTLMSGILNAFVGDGVASLDDCERYLTQKTGSIQNININETWPRTNYNFHKHHTLPGPPKSTPSLKTKPRVHRGVGNETEGTPTRGPAKGFAKGFVKGPADGSRVGW